MSKEQVNLNDFFNTNIDANVDNESASSELYMGVGKYKVVKVEAADELDANKQRRIRIVFGADNNDINNVVSKTYWLKDEVRKSKLEKTEFINAFGKTVFADDEAGAKAYGWFDTTDLRPAKVGEAELTQDFRVLKNSKSKDQLTLKKELFEMLYNGDTSILEYALIGDKPKKAMLMVGVKENDDKYYNCVYKVIKPSWIKEPVEVFQEMLDKDAESEYSNVKEGEAYKAQELKKYTPEESSNEEQSEEKEQFDLF